MKSAERPAGFVAKQLTAVLLAMLMVGAAVFSFGFHEPKSFRPREFLPEDLLYPCQLRLRVEDDLGKLIEDAYCSLLPYSLLEDSKVMLERGEVPASSIQLSRRTHTKPLLAANGDILWRSLPIGPNCISYSVRSYSWPYSTHMIETVNLKPGRNRSTIVVPRAGAVEISRLAPKLVTQMVVAPEGRHRSHPMWEPAVTVDSRLPCYKIVNRGEVLGCLAGRYDVWLHGAALRGGIVFRDENVIAPDYQIEVRPGRTTSVRPPRLKKK